MHSSILKSALRFGLLLLFVIASPYWSIAQDETLLLRMPAVSNTHIAFVHGGDIWVANRDGSYPRRLTVNPAVEQNPYFSPDGKHIAFSGNYDGNTDVYVVPVEGGEPQRVTWHPGADMVAGWLDNETIYFSSVREFTYAVSSRLHKISIKGGYPTALPMPEAVQGSASPDGRHWAYIKNMDPTDRPTVAFKRYRGGGMPDIWIFDTRTNDIEIIPGATSNNIKPQWVGNKIYFLSDRSMVLNLYSYDVATKTTEAVTNSRNYDVKSLTSFGKMLAYEMEGRIHLYDTETKQTTQVKVRLGADVPYKRTRYEDMSNHIREFSISPTGVRVMFNSRGDIFTVPREKGDARNISSSPGAHDRAPAWSPDGKWVSYFSDAKGNGYQLVLRDQLAESDPVYIKLSENGFHFNPKWSPDSKMISYNDANLNLYYMNVADRKPVKFDSDTDASTTGRTGDPYSISWSPDSRWIAYNKSLPNGARAIFLYDTETRARHQITDGMSNAITPTFSRDGKYLFFQASTNVGLTNSGLHMTSYDRPVEYHLYAWILSKDTPSLYKPESDEEPVKTEGETKPEAKSNGASADKTVKIDLEGISNQIVSLPISSRMLGSLDGSVEGKIIYSKAGEIFMFELKTMKESSLVASTNGFAISADGKKMVYLSRGNYFVVDAGKKPGNDEGRLNLSGIKVMIDPAAEWNNIYHDVWLIQKEMFYVENMHGLNWEETKKKYAKFLPFVNHRWDLNYVFGEMMGEMSVGHNYIRGGDQPDGPNVGIGMLAADYTIENNRYRISKIFSRMDWNPGVKAPLTEPGLNINQGDYILAVNGIPLDGSMSIYSLFEFTVGKQVKLRINSRPSMDGSREVIVVPISSGAETSLRRTAWMEEKRAMVDRLSNNTIAYVYMPNTGRGGYDSFNRYYFAQMDKKALLLDERNNGGGSVADYVTDLLARQQMTFWGIRDGKSFGTPGNGIYGPMAMVINENAGSGGDMLPYMFRFKGLGKLVGRTTMGILVGISGYPDLIDGGSITSPNFGIYDLESRYIIENEGVAPDIFVEQTPKELLAGKDPQLEATIKLLMEEMKTYPYVTTPKPQDPIRVR
jgi:tricorn protease